MAVRNGHSDVAALLIKYNVDIDLPDSSGNTPLHHAAAYGWLDCVELLLKYGADPSPEKCLEVNSIDNSNAEKSPIDSLGIPEITGTKTLTIRMKKEEQYWPWQC